jgi:FdhD protein
VRVEIASRCQDRLVRTRRALAGRTGCGLCGTESLEQAIRLPTPVEDSLVGRLSSAGIERALSAMSAHQPLSAQCGATHAAFWCSPEGQILEAREDVGRHNALDKLIGARLRRRDPSREGFVLMTSRASYEIVQKTAVWGCSSLVTVSAPTSLAVDLAQRSGICLVGFARPGRWSAYTFEERVD